jgi:hypothetical protein
MENITNLLEAVENITDNIQENIGYDDGQYCLVLKTDGSIFIVTFQDIELWSSEEETRLLDDDDEPIELLEDCLRRRLKEELIKLAELKNVLFGEK